MRKFFLSDVSRETFMLYESIDNEAILHIARSVRFHILQPKHGMLPSKAALAYPEEYTAQYSHMREGNHSGSAESKDQFRQDFFRLSAKQEIRRIPKLST